MIPNVARAVSVSRDRRRSTRRVVGSAAEAQIVALHLVIVHDRAQDAVERQVAQRLLDGLQGRVVIDDRPRAFAAASAGDQRRSEGSGERQTCCGSHPPLSPARTMPGSGAGIKRDRPPREEERRDYFAARCLSTSATSFSTQAVLAGSCASLAIASAVPQPASIQAA